MTRPVTSRKTFGYFGLMIGSLPLFTAAIKIFRAPDPAFVGFLFLVAGILTGLVGFGFGRRYVPRFLVYASNYSLANRLLLWIVLGTGWGALSGAAGGLVFLLIGCIPGALVGGIVGAAAVPVMVALHSTMKVGDEIEVKHFLPIAFGITLSICAFVLGS